MWRSDDAGRGSSTEAVGMSSGPRRLATEAAEGVVVSGAMLATGLAIATLWAWHCERRRYDG